jgi:MinD superfamily P-loop ATPase
VIISVASGKGGTGKTLVATSLALTLKSTHRVQLLDCDVEEPDDHLFMKPVITDQEAVSIPVPVIDLEKCDHCGICAEVCSFKAIAVWGKQAMVFSQLCHGCGACSYLCPQRAIREEPRVIGVVESGDAGGVRFTQGKLDIGEAMSPPVIRKVKAYADGEEVTVIDSPPGTSCPVITAVKNSHYCLLVTEPTPFGLNDLRLAAEMVRELGIPFGVVINRNSRYESDTEQYCQRSEIPVLLTIPLDTEIARLYSRGVTLVEGMPQWRKSFVELYERINRALDGRAVSETQS